MFFWASPMAQWVKNQFAMQETQEMRVWSLGGEDPLEKEMTTHSSILALKIPWTEESGRLQSMGLQRLGHDWSDLTHTQQSPELAETAKVIHRNQSPILNF